jgi:hypothetical protein
VNVTDPVAFRARVDDALTSGSARVDRAFPLGAGFGQMCVIGGDGTVFWLRYHPDLDPPRATVIAVQVAGGVVEAVTGVACRDDGFLLAGDHRYLIGELLARSHHDMTVVRGEAAAFDGVGTL